jgi:hypothetical protein
MVIEGDALATPPLGKTVSWPYPLSLFWCYVWVRIVRWDMATPVLSRRIRVFQKVYAMEHDNP